MDPIDPAYLAANDRSDAGYYIAFAYIISNIDPFFE
jgi:hypothetical protein